MTEYVAGGGDGFKIIADNKEKHLQVRIQKYDKASKNKVMKYTGTGQAITLPNLNAGRCGHACGKVTKKDGSTVSFRS